MPQASDIPTASLAPLDADRFGEAEARHLLWRAGFGGSASQVRELASMGPEKAVSVLLDPERDAGTPPPAASAFDGSIMSPPTPQQRAAYQRARRAQDEDTLAMVRRERMEREAKDRAQIRQMQRWWLTRMIQTTRPMEEKLALFWHGHFATSYRTIENSYHLYLQNQLFRAHAAGSFADLLRGIVRDPAMLAYLDNNDSRKEKPNENLARELLELFSLGEGHYEERDIKEGARALTGSSFEGNAYVFRAEWHDHGRKTILGRTGALDGRGFCEAILARPEASQFITLKLYRFLVGSLPGAGDPRRAVVVGVVRDLARTLAGAGYELRPMLRRLLLSEHFYDPLNRLTMIKSPADLIVGAVRSLGSPARDLGAIDDAMDLMGQRLFFPPGVKGWEGGRGWINTSTLYVRQNAMNYLLTGAMPGAGLAPPAGDGFDGAALLDDLERAGHRLDGPDDVARALVAHALGRPAQDEEAQALAPVLGRRRSVRGEGVGRALALIAVMPEYQLL